MTSYKYLFFFLFACTFLSCEPQQDESRELGPQPNPPDFTVSMIDPNTVALTVTSSDFFDYIWELPGASPSQSEERVDTVFYPIAGDYAITLYGASESGNGTSSNTKIVTIIENALVECDATLELLTNACTNKCWKLSGAPGSVKVGPSQLSGEWFTSTGIEPEQADDLWCFNAETLMHEYLNNGATFSACQGYVIDDNYPSPGEVSWNVLPSDSEYSQFEITLPFGSWMGVEDSGPVYEIISITEDELILLTTLAPCDGSPSTGWFTFVFEKE